MSGWLSLCSGSLNANCLRHRYIQFLPRCRWYFLLYCLSLRNHLSKYWHCVSNTSQLPSWVYLLEWSWDTLFGRNVLSFGNTCHDTLYWRYILGYSSLDYMQTVYSWQLLSSSVCYTWMCFSSNLSYRLFLLRGNWVTFRISMPIRNLRSNNRAEHIATVYKMRFNLLLSLSSDDSN